jgi:hypothetical protein
MKIKTEMQQRGLSLTGLIFMLAIFGALAVLGMKVVPTVTEYMSIKKAIAKAKADGSSPREIQASFEKQADVFYISSITAKDLDISRSDDGYDVSFAYEKKIPLVGPVSLVIDYEGSTGRKAPQKSFN